MKRIIFGIFIIGLFLTFTEAKTENWKQYFKDEDGIWNFDKDSIHYPDKTGKSILRVWSKFGGKWLLLEQLYCSTRIIEIVERYDSTGFRNSRS